VVLSPVLSQQRVANERLRPPVWQAGEACFAEVAYVHVRADGRCQLNIHAEITTEDGKKISLAADGVAIPEDGSPVFQRKENVTLMTNHPEYSWVNPIQVWAPGTVDVSKGEIRIKGQVV
jgi:hypothetical protein